MSTGTGGKIESRIKQAGHYAKWTFADLLLSRNKEIVNELQTLLFNVKCDSVNNPCSCNETYNKSLTVIINKYRI